MEKHSGHADEQYCRRGGRIGRNNTDCTYTRNSDTPMKTSANYTQNVRVNEVQDDKGIQRVRGKQQRHTKKRIHGLGQGACDSPIDWSMISLANITCYNKSQKDV
eukprot:8830668-Ditylum_brightwellii.AAC.1